MTAATGDVLRGALDRFAVRAAAEGLVEVAYATMDSPVGTLLVATTDAGVVRIGFAGEVDDVLDDLARRVSPRVLRRPDRLDGARRELDEYFAGRRTEFEMPLDRTLIGPFGRRVLGRTSQIPYGQVAAYTEVARDIGAPRAARAVGNALGANPIPVVIPCHRVVRTGGALGGYGGGLPRKRALLELEGALSA
jgi:methylated-DNA-[protein]-cysteine S-methyltransferase